jgi:hypothetical protein
MQATRNPGTPAANAAIRILVLAFGGAAALQWVHSALLGDGTDGAAPGALNWLRDGAVALPFVAAAVLLASRGGSGIAPYYAAITGAGAILAALFPAGGGHASHDVSDLSTIALLGHAGAMMLAAAAYAVLADSVAGAVGGELVSRFERFMPRTRFGRAVITVAAVVALAPAVVLTGAQKAAAQTSFPDQAIHPRGSLTLVAQTLPDGSMAYIAPEYGANGVRPTIEMTEGETLNITL